MSPAGYVEPDPVYPFVRAKNFTRADRKVIDLIVIHDMEAPEREKTAATVAAWFGSDNAPQASAHYCVDDKEIVQCVREEDVAWHAPGANHNGIGIEHAGYASQTANDWADEYSTAMLKRSAELVARLCLRWDIPVVFCPDAILKLPGARGITTHKAITDGLNGGKGHWDPGPNFPMTQFLDWVREAREALLPFAAQEEGASA